MDPISGILTSYHLYLTPQYMRSVTQHVGTSESYLMLCPKKKDSLVASGHTCLSVPFTKYKTTMKICL